MNRGSGSGGAYLHYLLRARSVGPEFVHIWNGRVSRWFRNARNGRRRERCDGIGIANVAALVDGNYRVDEIPVGV